MPWARASALHRHLECSAASWLPRAERGAWHPGYLVASESLVARAVGAMRPPEDDSVMAEWGTAMHLAKEDPEKSSDPWRSWMEPHRERLWPAGLGVHEQAWAYDCRTGIVTMWQPGDGDKDIWKRARGPSTVTGTTDWDAQLPGGEPWVDDLKTGWPVPALTTPQMLMYALVASKRSRYHAVRLSITHWRRGWTDPDRRWQQVGPATLSNFEEGLRAAWLRASGPNPEARPGPHCRYCPSAAVCPTVTGQEDEDA